MQAPKPLTIRIPAPRNVSAPARTTAALPLAPPTQTHHQTASGSDPRLGASARLDVGSDMDDTPTPGLHIPNVCTAKSEAWKDVVRHWVSGAPELGLETPLKDWPKEWTKDANRRRFAMKHHNRSIIAKEFLET
jgi:hypothetical protein